MARMRERGSGLPQGGNLTPVSITSVTNTKISVLACVLCYCYTNKKHDKNNTSINLKKKRKVG